MKKLNLKLLASLLSVVTILSSAPASATVGCDAWFGAGAGIFGAAWAAAGVMCGVSGEDPRAVASMIGSGVGCSLWGFKRFFSGITGQNTHASTPTRRPAPTPMRRPAPTPTFYQPSAERSLPPRDVTTAPRNETNANLTNTAGLCHWHALVQQLYSIQSFRDFVEKTNPDDFYISEKLRALRTLFQQMKLPSRVGKDECRELAMKVLPHDKIGYWQDMHEDWVRFMSGIVTQYKNYCRREYSSGSNIFETPLKLEGEGLTLQSILNQQEDTVAKCDAVRDKMLSNPAIKKEIMDAYCYKFAPGSSAEMGYYWDYRRTGVLSGEFLNIIATDLSDLPRVQRIIEKAPRREYDIPVIEGQFSVFISRGIANNQMNTKNIDFGNGTIFYKGNIYHLTGVSYYYRGHYCTLKEQSGHWYLYDDCESEVLPAFKEDFDTASSHCTMLTFTHHKE